MHAIATDCQTCSPNSYGKAKAYLQRVLQVFPSMEAGNTLEKIKKMELELK
jgi:hypothetical protein